MGRHGGKAGEQADTGKATDGDPPGDDPRTRHPIVAFQLREAIGGGPSAGRLGRLDRHATPYVSMFKMYRAD
jgi:hypothetical protein